MCSCFIGGIFFARGLIEYDFFKNIYLDDTLTGSTTTGLSVSGTNAYKGELHTIHTSRIGVSPSDVVKCHTQDTTFLYVSEDLTFLQGKLSTYLVIWHNATNIGPQVRIELVTNVLA